MTGSVPKKLIRFAFPLFLANLLQALYNVVDMLVVGKIVGKTGLAAISNASMLCFIINSLCIGLTSVLSQIILDNTSAAEQIPKDARGRFITGDGTVFQGYLFNEEQL